jgi:fructosamine-3-kinase
MKTFGTKLFSTYGFQCGGATVMTSEEFLADAVQTACGRRPTRIARLTGGCVSEAYRVWLPDGASLAAKVDRSANAVLACEGAMLTYLKRHSALPVPTTLHVSDSLLLMEYVAGASRFSSAAERHAAELLAALHEISHENFGFEFDTLIGGLHQPNPPTASWIAFFRDARLLHMGREAMRSGGVSSALFSRLEKFCDRLGEFLEEPERPSLVHGDAWTTNILADGDRITGFIDPAIYFAHAEVELAFVTMFGTFGRPFFERYEALRPIRPGFWELRRDIYNLYSALVHIRLGYGGYAESVGRTLRACGF